MLIEMRIVTSSNSIICLSSRSEANSYCFRPISLPESTKQLTELKQSTAENLEIPVNPSDVVMRGTIYQNSEAEQSSCPSPSPPTQSTQSLRERCVKAHRNSARTWQD